MTLRGIQNAAHSMLYYARLQEVTANNLANVSTDGFKADRLTARMSGDGLYPVPVEEIDLRQGTLRETGRPLDLALEGEGFLVVSTPSGERLTRGGSYRLDAAGQLTDGEGNVVLGERGPIVAPSGALVVQADGAVIVDGAEVDRLRLERPADPASLRKEGHGRFLADATVPAAELKVRQGQVEEANHDAIIGMVDLVTIQRAYAANADALKAMDSVLGTIATDLARI
jgi:flagellar basal body rod protein FlgG